MVTSTVLLYQCLASRTGTRCLLNDILSPLIQGKFLDVGVQLSEPCSLTFLTVMWGNQGHITYEASYPITFLA